ncbi:MAG: hypothetical protein KDE35_06370 [Geminicoccaceae bacterium]|nr:hypothetical protein [Geminicoccaceae bacterium]
MRRSIIHSCPIMISGALLLAANAAPAGPQVAIEQIGQPWADPPAPLVAVAPQPWAADAALDALSPAFAARHRAVCAVLAECAALNDRPFATGDTSKEERAERRRAAARSARAPGRR